MVKNLSTTYDPKQVEEKWYQHWEGNGYFTAEVKADREAFSIVMPPPNVTGSLHLGHALDNTLQDILTRWKRMQGLNVLWLPGTDHAGIATQAKVEEQLVKEGTNKYELGREKFLERTWDWKHQYGNRITEQLRKLGTSCDWSRERFTMDEGCSQAVKDVFVKLYEKGLIYRGEYIINWCPKCQTTISDIEVEHAPQVGKIYHIKYPIIDSEEYIIVATTRPETMLGDTAVAVNPEDERYKNLIGKKILLPLMEREIPIIVDEYVDSSFGTGAVKITPAHDPNDFEMGQRHNLPSIAVMTKEARMNENAGSYEGYDCYEARKHILMDLEQLGLLVKVEEHENSVGHCYRCDTVIQPMVSKQWFVKMQPLAEPAIKAVKTGETKFVPERFTKIYLGWLENIRDWCISRQLWWGHRIPVWYCQNCNEIIVAKEEPSVCSCGCDKLEQDPDVLDTWFSSGLWPFSTLGWPDDTLDLKTFYPTSVLVTGRDIIFFWVARMIFTALEFMDEVPFKEVFIHGLVLDSQGRKMSKSLGNGVDPLEVIEQYGADTLRFMLITGNTPGNDIRFQFERLEATRNFANKIWNASRFVLMNLEGFDPKEVTPQYTLADRWILSRFKSCTIEVTRNLERYDLGEAAREIYEFIWNEFCDWYIELVKPRLYGKETEESKKTAQFVLCEILRGSMELLHPFMPFISEEIWHHLPHEDKSIMFASWPEFSKEEIDSDAQKQMGTIMDVIKVIRNLRGEMNVPPSKKADMVLLAADDEYLRILENGQSYIKGLAGGESITINRVGQFTLEEEVVSAVVTGVEIYLPLKGLIDLEKEIARIEKELVNLDKEIGRLEGKLNNQGFLAKAPADVVAIERAKHDDYVAKKNVLIDRAKVLKG